MWIYLNQHRKMFEKIESTLFARWPAGFTWNADEISWFQKTTEWVRGGMVWNFSQFLYTTNQGMPSEIVCEHRVRNVTHKNFSTFLCTCGTKRKNESENEKKGNPRMWFPQYHYLTERLSMKCLQHIFMSPARLHTWGTPFLP